MTPTPTTPTPTSSTSPTVSCISATPDQNGYVPPGACNSLYLYYPSFDAAAAAAGVFLILSILHLVQGIRFKKGYTWTIIMGALWETASFGYRAYGTKHQQEEMPVVVSQVLLLLAPLWINAFVYMVVGRMIYFFLPAQKIWGLKATSFSKVFVGLDIVSFLVQAAGAILVSNPNASHDQLTLGKNIYMAGIGVQQAFIFLFGLMLMRFHYLMHQVDRQMQVMGKKGWTKLVYAFYLALAMISTRIIYRLVEYTGGVSPSNGLITHEYWMYVLDAVPMAIAVFILVVIHPGGIVRGEGSEFPKLSRKEKKALQEQEKHEKRQRKATAEAERRRRKEIGTGAAYEEIGTAYGY